MNSKRAQNIFDGLASQYMGVEAPVPVSAKLDDLNIISHIILNTAEHPHSSIPERQDNSQSI
ncbi:hypothetical protein L484_024876 [Morus notabilis]|uniref:Uncharacterized protein n=1 Tax=Morus notabilis TaxID=981085 RepID=W9QWX0_9ROSA|nr:hypothetical protein L484_024876 [Morus notabilis]